MGDFFGLTSAANTVVETLTGPFSGSSPQPKPISKFSDFYDPGDPEESHLEGGEGELDALYRPFSPDHHPADSLGGSHVDEGYFDAETMAAPESLMGPPRSMYLSPEEARVRAYGHVLPAAEEGAPEDAEPTRERRSRKKESTRSERKEAARNARRAQAKRASRKTEERSPSPPPPPNKPPQVSDALAQKVDMLRARASTRRK